MPEELDKFIDKIKDFKHIQVKGLMTIAPFVENPETNREIFRSLRKLSVDISNKNVDNVNVSILEHNYARQKSLFQRGPLLLLLLQRLYKRKIGDILTWEY